jgi:transglutaminase-like putative cysteine protease/lipoprotein NlpI
MAGSLAALGSLSSRIRSRTLAVRGVVATLTVGLCFSVLAAPAATADAGREGMREVTLQAESCRLGVAAPAWFQAQTAMPETASPDPVVMQLSEAHFRVAPIPVVVLHRVIRVNEASALADVGQYPITFQPEYQRVEVHALKVRRGTEIIDKLASASVRFFHSERSAEEAIYTGQVTAVVVTQDLRPGDSFDITYSLIGQNPIYGGHYVDAAAWGSTVPVLRRRVVLDLPTDRSVAFRVIGTSADRPDLSARQETHGDRRLIRFEGENLPAVEDEALAPPDVSVGRWIQFSDFRTWREVNAWAAQLFELKGTEAQLLPELPAAPSRQEDVMRALHFVEDDIRYLSIAIGDNSHRPAPPGDVASRRYGDCKDKSLLLLSLLRRLGVAADPVLVPTRSRKAPTGLLPTPTLFDHVIVRAQMADRVYFLDPTVQGQGKRLEHIGQYHQGLDVLVVRPDTRGLQVIPMTRREGDSVSRRVERVQLRNMDEPAEMSVDFTFAYEDAEAMRRALGRLSHVQLRKYYEGLLDRRYPGAELSNEVEVKDDGESNFIAVTARYRLPRFAESTGGKWVVRYEASNLDGLLPLPRAARRQFPVFVAAYPWTGEYSLEVTLPEDFDARYTPSKRSLKGEAFQIDESLSFSGRTLREDLRLALTADRVSAASAARLIADSREADGYLRGSVTVSDRDRRVPTTPVTLKESSRKRLEAVLLTTEGALASARAGGRETFTVHCERARAAAYLGRSALALEEGEIAVSEQPESADALACRGTVRFIEGDFDGSIRDLTRALALGVLDPEASFQRGLANFYARRWKEAAGDFSTYRALAADARGKARAEVWEVLARQQNGDAAPASALAEAVWPAPVLGLFAGKASIEDLLDQLNRSESGYSLDERLAEAYFFSSLYFSRSNHAKAKAYLQRSLDIGPLYSLIQVAAKHEMRRRAQAESTGDRP